MAPRNRSVAPGAGICAWSLSTLAAKVAAAIMGGVARGRAPLGVGRRLGPADSVVVPACLMPVLVIDLLGFAGEPSSWSRSCMPQWVINR